MDGATILVMILVGAIAFLLGRGLRRAKDARREAPEQDQALQRRDRDQRSDGLLGTGGALASGLAMGAAAGAVLGADKPAEEGEPADPLEAELKQIEQTPPDQGGYDDDFDLDGIDF